ncbi:isoquinoline 1-oxidoreductase, alpha subunit [Streptomyces wuyuanensis]|uniref:Isoquinoline 1-oxidoreductase, alpha subunit n=1 Tax=Streptomyces wuyuanensis TaxID=1196353 RepID=A0A1G9TUD0_9ACTN|nr:isoquinoline 1-oxidoreductase, alpha subunit [Streptomyces wuyuanensis]
MQEAWLDHDVSQCGSCRPGQITAAVAKVRQAREAGREIGGADRDEIRNICRCGTCDRIREAVVAGAQRFCRVW